MLRYFYQRTTRSSAQQLREDFGAFPPFPLQCAQSSSSFVLVRVRGPGAWINYWRRSEELLGAFESSPETVTSELLALLDGFRQTDSRAAQLFTIPRWAMRVVLIIGFRRVFRSRRRAMGLVLPMTRDDRQITLFGKTNGNSSLRNEVLAHEHVHFLQNQQDSSRSKELQNPHQILPQERAEDPFSLYLLECAEVEARLHELVLSHYRAKRMLPQTLDTFLSMLADWDEMGAYLVQMAAYAGLTMQATGNPFAIRSAMFSGQLADVLGILKNPEMTKRFVCEVLPVMYTNLLHYYGDVSASANFAAQIARPNLYDALYGAERPA